MISENIATRLLNELGLVFGESLFINTTPATVTEAVMIGEPLSGFPFDHDIPDRYKGRFQIVTRHVDPQDGYRLALEAQRALTLEVRTQIEATDMHQGGWIDYFLPETLPIIYPKLDGNFFEWSQHFKTVFKVKPHIAI